MAAPIFFVPVQRISGIRANQEEEIRIQQNVYDIDERRHTKKDQHILVGMAPIGTNIFTSGEHNRVEDQQNMYGKGMDAHQIPAGQGIPGREKHSRQSTGDTNCVEEATDGSAASPGVPGNEKVIDAAKVEGKIIRKPAAGDDQRDLFDQFIGNQPNGDGKGTIFY